MLNESNTIKTIFTMFTLPRGCIGLRKSSLWSQVLWTVLWCLNKHCSTTPLRLGRGTWAFDWVFRHIRPFSFFYTMVNTVWASDEPAPALVNIPRSASIDFLALSKEIRPTASSKRSLWTGTGSRRGGKRTLKPLRWVWCWEVCGVAFLFVTLVSFRARFSRACLIYYLSFYY